MKRLDGLLLLVLWLGAMDASGQMGEQRPSSFTVDLDGNGLSSQISWRETGEDDEVGKFYQWIVRGPDGAVRWRGPDEMDVENPLVLGEWEFGTALPEVFGPVLADGRLAAIVPEPRSDVSPPVFRVLAWDGEALRLALRKGLTGETKVGGQFRWVDDPDENKPWVNRFVEIRPDGLVVEVWQFGQSGLRMGQAVLRPEGDGFRVVAMPEPMAAADSEEESPNELAKPFAIEVTFPQESRAALSYRARLSRADHYNSQGTPLRSAADILRQDRANYHRDLHRDREDEGDSRFGSIEQRKRFTPQSVQVVGGSKNARRIIEGTPLVEVRVQGSQIEVEVLRD